MNCYEQLESSTSFHMGLFSLIQVHILRKVIACMFFIKMSIEVIGPHISQTSFDGTPFITIVARVALFIEFLCTSILREVRTIPLINLVEFISMFLEGVNQFYGAHVSATKSTDVRPLQVPLHYMATNMCSHISQWEELPTGEAPRWWSI